MKPGPPLRYAVPTRSTATNWNVVSSNTARWIFLQLVSVGGCIGIHYHLWLSAKDVVSIELPQASPNSEPARKRYYYHHSPQNRSFTYHLLVSLVVLSSRLLT
jgi:hypothetical protein